MKLRWSILIPGLAATTVAALGVHAAMVGPLHIPYPYNYPRAGWPVFPDVFVCTLAASYVLPLLDTRFQRLSIGYRCFMLFLLPATIKEALFRAAFMNMMNSASILYPIVQALPKLTALAMTAALIVFSAAYARKGWTRWVWALVISVFVFFVWEPSINLALNRLLASIAWMSGPSLYDPPYDYHILIPAYLSFLEPVVASFFMAALVWKNLPSSTLLRTAAFALLVVMLKPFLNIHFAHTGATVALLSEGQFTFESIVLGCLTALTWVMASGSRMLVTLNEESYTTHC